VASELNFAPVTALVPTALQTTLPQTVSVLTPTVTALVAAAPPFIATLPSLTTPATTVTESTAALLEPIPALAAPVTALAAPLSGLTGPVAALTAPVAVLAPPLAAPVTALTTAVPALTEPVVTLAEPVVTLAESVTALAAPVADLAEPVAALTAPVNALTEPVTALATTALAEPVPVLTTLVTSAGDGSATVGLADPAPPLIVQGPAEHPLGVLSTLVVGTAAQVDSPTVNVTAHPAVQFGESGVLGQGGSSKAPLGANASAVPLASVEGSKSNAIVGLGKAIQDGAGTQGPGAGEQQVRLLLQADLAQQELVRQSPANRDDSPAALGEKGDLLALLQAVGPPVGALRAAEGGAEAERGGPPDAPLPPGDQEESAPAGTDEQASQDWVSLPPEGAGVLTDGFSLDGVISDVLGQALGSFDGIDRLSAASWALVAIAGLLACELVRRQRRDGNEEGAFVPDWGRPAPV
jgi:hypothetical protein